MTQRSHLVAAQPLPSDLQLDLAEMRAQLLGLEKRVRDLEAVERQGRLWTRLVAWWRPLLDRMKG